VGILLLFLGFSWWCSMGHYWSCIDSSI